MTAPYPWLAESWARLERRVEQGRLGHAHLFTGANGLGQGALADALAARLLCETAHARPCDSCRSCRLLAAHNHPDLVHVGPLEERRVIAIDQIRELIEFFALKPHYGAHKLAIIAPADALNAAAANALLKLLEEPPPNAVLVLVTDRPYSLPATILSRCQRTHCAMPNWAERERWLQSVMPDLPTSQLCLRGAPLALQARIESRRATLYNDAIAVLHRLLQEPRAVLDQARRFADDDIAETLDALESCVQACVQLCASHEPSALRLPVDCRQQLQEIADKLHLRPLLAFLDKLGDARGYVTRSSGVRASEIIENLCYEWTRVARLEDAR